MAPTSPRGGGQIASVAFAVIAVLVCALTALGGPATARPAPRHLAVTHLLGWSTRELRVIPGSTQAVTVRLGSRGGVAGRPVLLQRQRLGGHGWATVARTTTDARGTALVRWRNPADYTRFWVRLRVPAVRRHALGVTTVARLVSVVKDGSGSTDTSGGGGQPGDTDTTPSDSRISDVLDLVNKARATGRTCGSVHYDAVPALALNSRLDKAAGDYAEQMATQDFFSHTSPNGDDPGDRITAAGYTWHAWGENIAAGQQSASDVVNAWLASAGHCANLMDSHFVDVGVGVGTDTSSTYGIYWVMDLGHP